MASMSLVVVNSMNSKGVNENELSILKKGGKKLRQKRDL